MMQAKGQQQTLQGSVIKGANTGEVEDELAIHTPKALIPVCTTGHTTANTREIITDQAITTIGTNRLPLKNANASGSFRKL